MRSISLLRTYLNVERKACVSLHCMKNHHSLPIHNQVLREGTSPENDGAATPRLLELVSLRVSQIHQCQDSIDMHRELLRSMGETKEQLEELETWETSTLFNGGERAALTLCDKITLNPSEPLTDVLIRRMRNYFTKESIVSLTLTIIAVNDWSYGIPKIF